MASVKGFVERNDRIDNRRPLNETYLVMDGGTCEVIDVSMGGISFAGAKEKFPLGKNISIKGVRIEDEEMVEFGAFAEVVRSVSRASGGIGLKFNKLTSKQFGIVEALVMHRPLVPKKKKTLPKKKKGFLG